MKIARRVYAGFAALPILLICLLFPAFAQKTYVYDNANLMTAQETEALETQIGAAAVMLEKGFDIVIVTTGSTDGKTPMAFADDFYDYNGFSRSGILLLVSMEERDVYISTSGDAISAYTDDDISKMIGNITPYLSAGRYYEAASRFIRDCDYYGTSKAGVFAAFWICLIIALVVATIVCVVAYRRYKTPKAQATGNYMDAGKTRFTESTDRYVTSRYTRVPKSDGSRGGGSSSHISGSGRSHGGGGGKF